jgi:hypothetical protein
MIKLFESKVEECSHILEDKYYRILHDHGYHYGQYYDVLIYKECIICKKLFYLQQNEVYSGHLPKNIPLLNDMNIAEAEAIHNKWFNLQ